MYRVRYEIVPIIFKYITFYRCTILILVSTGDQDPTFHLKNSAHLAKPKDPSTNPVLFSF